MKSLIFGLLLITGIANATPQCPDLFPTNGLSKAQFSAFTNPQATARDILQLPPGFTDVNLDRHKTAITKQLKFSLKATSHQITANEVRIDAIQEQKFHYRLSEATSALREELYRAERTLTGWLTDGIERENVPHTLRGSLKIWPDFLDRKSRSLKGILNTYADLKVKWFGETLARSGLSRILNNRESRLVLQVPRFQQALLDALTSTLETALNHGTWPHGDPVNASFYFREWAQQDFKTDYLFAVAQSLSPYPDVQLAFVLNITVYGALVELNAQNASQLRLPLEALVAESLYAFPTAYDQLPESIWASLSGGPIGLSNLSRFFTDAKLADYVLTKSVLAVEPRRLSEFVRILMRIDDAQLLKRYRGRYLDEYLVNRFATLSAFYYSSSWSERTLPERILTSDILKTLTYMRQDLYQGFTAALHAVIHLQDPASASEPSRSTPPEQPSLGRPQPPLLKGPQP